MMSLGMVWIGWVEFQYWNSKQHRLGHRVTYGQKVCSFVFCLAVILSSLWMLNEENSGCVFLTSHGQYHCSHHWQESWHVLVMEPLLPVELTIVTFPTHVPQWAPDMNHSLGSLLFRFEQAKHQYLLLKVHHVHHRKLLANLAECVSSTVSTQNQLTAVAVLGLQLVHTTAVLYYL